MKSLVMATCVLGLAGLAQANIVTNGGFESSTNAQPPDSWQFYNTTGPLAFTSISTTTAHTGTNDFRSGPTSNNPLAGIQQALTGPAGTYDIDFWVYHEGSTPNEFKVIFGGTTLLDLVNDTTTLAWTHYTFPGVSACANPSIQFGIYHSPTYWHLDDVNVVATPAPASLALLGIGGLIAGRRRRA